MRDVDYKIIAGMAHGLESLKRNCGWDLSTGETAKYMEIMYEYLLEGIPDLPVLEKMFKEAGNHCYPDGACEMTTAKEAWVFAREMAGGYGKSFNEYYADTVARFCKKDNTWVGYFEDSHVAFVLSDKNKREVINKYVNVGDTLSLSGIKWKSFINDKFPIYIVELIHQYDENPKNMKRFFYFFNDTEQKDRMVKDLVDSKDEEMLGVTVFNVDGEYWGNRETPKHSYMGALDHEHIVAR